MVLDTERNLLAVQDEYIFLSIGETILLDLIIRNKRRGITIKEIQKEIYPYTFAIRALISGLRKKIFKYAEIYSERNRYKIHYYGKGIYLLNGSKR